MFGVNRNLNIQQILKVLNGNPEELFNQMYKENEDFKKFVDENKGKSVEEIAKKYGIPI